MVCGGTTLAPYPGELPSQCIYEEYSRRTLAGSPAPEYLCFVRNCSGFELYARAGERPGGPFECGCTRSAHRLQGALREKAYPAGCSFSYRLPHRRTRAYAAGRTLDRGALASAQKAARSGINHRGRIPRQKETTVGSFLTLPPVILFEITV